LSARNAVPGHEAISWNARNLTRVRQYTAADASAERKMYYDNLGNVVEVRDELQNVAATAFDTAYKFAYPTAVTVATTTATLATSATYAFDTGRVLTSTDARSQTTSYA
jgi:hypothetical protein